MSKVKGGETMHRVLLAGLYYRVSTERQADKGFSLPEQREACRKKAAELAREAGARLEYEEFEDHISGDHLERPAIDELQQFARKRRPDYIICLDPDRFSRKLVNQLVLANELEKWSKLTFVQHDRRQDAEGDLFFSLRGAIAQYQKAKILETTRRGVIGKLKAGKFPHGYAPYGYRFDTKDDTYVIIPEQAEWVRAVYRMWIDGERAPDIADYLTKLGVPTQRGAARWYASVVRGMLKSTTYKGIATYQKTNWTGITIQRQLPKEKRTGPIRGKARPPEEWIEIPVPAIISPEVWDAAQARFATRNVKAKGKLLLSGLVFCGICGAPVHYSSSPNKGKYNLRCHNRNPRRGYHAEERARCAQPYCYQVKAERSVRAAVLAWLIDPATILRALQKQAESNDTQTLLASVEREIQLVHSQLAEHRRAQAQTLNLLNRALLEPEVAEESLAASKAAIETAKPMLSQLEAKADQLRRSNGAENLERRLQLLRDRFGSSEEDIRDGLASLTLEEEQKVMRLLVAEIRMYPDGHLADGRFEVIPQVAPLVLS